MADPRVRNHYKVYDGDVCVFHGTTKEVAELFNIGMTSVYEYAKPERQILLGRRFRIVKDGTVFTPIKKKAAKKEIKKKRKEESDPFDAMYRRLLLDKNTICMPPKLKDATAYLKKRGLKFKSRIVEDKRDGDYYVLELIDEKKRKV